MMPLLCVSPQDGVEATAFVSTKAPYGTILWSIGEILGPCKLTPTVCNLRQAQKCKLFCVVKPDKVTLLLPELMCRRKSQAALRVFDHRWEISRQINVQTALMHSLGSSFPVVFGGRDRA